MPQDERQQQAQEDLSPFLTPAVGTPPASQYPESLWEYVSTFPGQVGKGLQLFADGLMSFVNILGYGVYEWATDPAETFDALLGPRGGEVASNVWSGILEDYEDRYGHVAKEGPLGLLKTIWHDPVAFTLDLTVLADGFGMGFKAAGSAANAAKGWSNAGRAIGNRWAGKLGAAPTIGDKLIRVGEKTAALPWQPAAWATKKAWQAMVPESVRFNLGKTLGTMPNARAVVDEFDKAQSFGQELLAKKLLKQNPYFKGMTAEEIKIADRATASLVRKADLSDEQRALAKMIKRERAAVERTRAGAQDIDNVSTMRSSLEVALLNNTELHEGMIKGGVIAEGTAQDTAKALRKMGLQKLDEITKQADSWLETNGYFKTQYRPIQRVGRTTIDDWIDSMGDDFVLADQRARLGRPLTSPEDFQKMRRKPLLDEEVQWGKEAYLQFLHTQSQYEAMGQHIHTLLKRAGAKRYVGGAYNEKRFRLVHAGSIKGQYETMAEIAGELGSNQLTLVERVLQRTQGAHKQLAKEALTDSFKLSDEVMNRAQGRYINALKQDEWFLVPEEAAIAIERIIAPAPPVLPFRILRSFNQWWKPLVLGLSPKYYLGNAAGAVVFSTLGKATPWSFNWLASAGVRNHIPAQLKGVTVPSEIAAIVGPRGGIVEKLMLPMTWGRGMARKSTALANSVDPVARMLVGLSEFERNLFKAGLIKTHRSFLGMRKHLSAREMESWLERANRARRLRNTYYGKEFQLPVLEKQLKVMQAALVEEKRIAELGKGAKAAEGAAKAKPTAGAKAKHKTAKKAFDKAKKEYEKTVKDIADPERVLRRLKNRRKQLEAERAVAKETASPDEIRAIDRKLAQETASIEQQTLELEATIKGLTAKSLKRKVKELEDRIGSIKGSKLSETDELAVKALETATTDAEQFLFNYNTSLSHYERKFMREIVPFYTFARNMMLLIGKSMFIRPKMMFAWHRMAEFSMGLLDDLGKPDWLRNYLPIGIDPESGAQLWVHFAGVNPMVSGLVSDDEAHRMLHPMIGVFLSAQKGVDIWGRAKPERIIGFNGTQYEVDWSRNNIRRKPVFSLNDMDDYLVGLMNQFPPFSFMQRAIKRYEAEGGTPEGAELGPELPVWTQQMLRTFNVNPIPQNLLERFEKNEKRQYRKFVRETIPGNIKRWQRMKRRDKERWSREADAQIRLLKQIRRDLRSGKGEFLGKQR